MREVVPEGVQEFLEKSAKYFENRPINGEDKNYWANVQNAENCRKAAARIAQLEQENARLLENNKLLNTCLQLAQRDCLQLEQENKKLRHKITDLEIDLENFFWRN